MANQLPGQRSGHRAVLMIVDVQVGVMRRRWQADEVIQRIASLVGRARSEGVPVLWVQHEDADLVHGGADWQWVPALQPAAGEPRIYKRYNSGFEDTTLDAELARLQATHIVLAGAATNWCIRATAYGALERGYDLSLVRDAHTTADIPLADGLHVPAAHIVDDLNLVMAWLEYPGRTNAVVGADDVVFDRPPVHAGQAG